VTEFEARLQVDVAVQVSFGTSFAPAELEEPLKLIVVGLKLQGCFSAQVVVPVESVKGVTEAVTVQPDPDPVASIAVSVKRPSWLMSYPLRVFDHLIVDEAPIDSEPPVTVACPVMVQSGVDLSSCLQLLDEAVEDTKTIGPRARTPTTNARPAHFADPWDIRSFNIGPPPVPSTRKDPRSLPPTRSGNNCKGRGELHPGERGGDLELRRPSEESGSNSHLPSAIYLRRACRTRSPQSAG